MKNKKIILKNFFAGQNKNDVFEILEEPMPRLSPGQILVKSEVLSLEPYMFGRIRSQKNYDTGASLNSTMIGTSVGKVVESTVKNITPGTYVHTNQIGWQSFGVVTESQIRVIDCSELAPSTYLGILGIPGLTALLALKNAATAKTGEKVIVTSASGAVGQIAGQLGSLMGCQMFAVAGSSEKVEHCKANARYHDGINYKSADFEKWIHEAGPFNIFLDGVGGAIHEKISTNLSEHFRTIIYGTISDQNGFCPTTLFTRRILIGRGTIKGFLLNDYREHFSSAEQELSQLAKSGKIKLQETRVSDLASAPRMLFALLDGSVTGKLLIDIT